MPVYTWCCTKLGKVQYCTLGPNGSADIALFDMKGPKTKSWKNAGLKCTVVVARQILVKPSEDRKSMFYKLLQHQLKSSYFLHSVGNFNNKWWGQALSGRWARTYWRYSCDSTIQYLWLRWTDTQWRNLKWWTVHEMNTVGLEGCYTVLTPNFDVS